MEKNKCFRNKTLHLVPILKAEVSSTVMTSWLLVLTMYKPADISPAPRLVTSSLWSPGWRSRMPASRCHWWHQDGETGHWLCWKTHPPLFILHSNPSSSSSPDLSLWYDVIYHYVNHCPGSKRQGVWQQRFCQDNSEGTQQPSNGLHHAA